VSGNGENGLGGPATLIRHARPALQRDLTDAGTLVGVEQFGKGSRVSPANLVAGAPEMKECLAVIGHGNRTPALELGFSLVDHDGSSLIQAEKAISAEKMSFRKSSHQAIRLGEACEE
jgi:hypothetical protein